ncbi:MAG: hypothetical protein LBL36_00995 [Clostridiales Family XIII bacterium]|nr:hypothetical protein [Clostridiales Family XIII bacterium]
MDALLQLIFTLIGCAIGAGILYAIVYFACKRAMMNVLGKTKDDVNALGKTKHDVMERL